MTCGHSSLVALHQFRIIIITILMTGGHVAFCADDVPFVPRAYYGAKLEPVDRVLHGAGQGHPNYVLGYSKAIGGAMPVLYMNYFNLKSPDPGKWASDLESQLKMFPQYVIPQIGVGMTHDGKPDKHFEQDVASGMYDDRIASFVAAIKSINRPFYLRIGYECNGSWNGYQPVTYVKAFRRFVEIMRRSSPDNIATVWCVTPAKIDDLLKYYPGDDVVDWWAIDIFWASGIKNAQPFIETAHQRRKPVMIGEATPCKIGVTKGIESWNQWFVPFFSLVHRNPGIKAVCYINWNWAQWPQWKDWGDARMESNVEVAGLYGRELMHPRYLHSDERSIIETTIQSELPRP